MINHTLEDHSRLILEKSLDYSSEITGSLAAGLLNLLSDYQHTSDLLEKFLVDMINGEQPNQNRLQLVAESVAEKSAEAVKLINSLKTFASILDAKEDDFEAIRVINHALAAIEKQADQRDIGLKTNIGEQPTWIYGNPFYLNQAIYVAGLNMLTIAPDGGVIQLMMDIGDTDIGFLASAKPENAEYAIDFDYLKILIRRLHGTLRAELQPEFAACEFVIPR